MKTYQINCANCGKAFIAYKSNTKTCSTNCRVSMHYLNKASNLMVLNSTGVERSTASAQCKNPIYINGVERSTQNETKKYYKDLGTKVLELNSKNGFENYFTKKYPSPIYNDFLALNNIDYILAGLYELDEIGFLTFYIEAGRNPGDFLLLETVMEFPAPDAFTDGILIYVHENLFDDFFNNEELIERYGYTPIDPENNSRLYYDERRDRWLVRKSV